MYKLFFIFLLLFLIKISFYRDCKHIKPVKCSSKCSLKCNINKHLQRKCNWICN